MEWYKQAYRRNVVDMHIEDWDPAFLADFDPVVYAEALRRGQVRSAVLYAHSHVGHCNYPTAIGHQHEGLNGRDIFGETLRELKARDIFVVGYFSLIFDTHAYRHHPEWRIITAAGRGAADASRYGVCCPNSGYRDYVAAHVGELARRYEVDGIRYDMTFWPSVCCYCPACRERFRQEVGGEIPTVINWEDSRWVAFQRKREQWLVEFGQFSTDVVKQARPAATVEHQSSTYPLDWTLGVTVDLADTNDFLQGDFYGDSVQGSLARKLFINMGRELPFGFETSICSLLQHHTNRKSRDLLIAKAHACLADSGAFVLIDAVDPAGTLNPTTYDLMGEVFEKIIPYEPYLGGALVQDIGVYFSTESKFDPADNGKDLAGTQTVTTNQVTGRCPHVDAVTNVCRALIGANVPYGVITRRNLDSLSSFKVLVLPEVLMMDEAETRAIRQYVGQGGTIFVSGQTGLLSVDGKRQLDFPLADVLGVSWCGMTDEDYTYMTPTDEGAGLFDGFSRRYPLGFMSRMSQLAAQPGVQVLATQTLPYTKPGDPLRFSSIHSNPPGIWTDTPALTINRFGAGQAIYSAAALETPYCHDIFLRILRLLWPRFTIESNAPKPVEITLFEQREKASLRLSLVNFQDPLPNIPIDELWVEIAVGNRPVEAVRLLPGGTEIAHAHAEGILKIWCPPLTDFIAIGIELGD